MLKCILINILLVSTIDFVSTEVRKNVLNLKRQVNTDDADNKRIESSNDCVCVNFYQCSDDNQVITNGENLFDLRFGRNTTRINCKGGIFYGELVCCKLNITTTDTKSPNTNINFGENTAQALHECGTQRTNINLRIFTEESNSINGEFPWIAAIYRKTADGVWKFNCSGALIHSKVILTANHYFVNANREHIKVILNGTVQLLEVGSNTDHERNVAEIVNHPQYYGGALYNDGALLILDRPFESTKTNSINSICLPPDEVIDSGRCLVAGWGRGSEVDGVKILKKVEIPLINFTTCQNLLRRTRLGTHYILHKSFMCAGGEKGKDACLGDGGSPLMCLLPSGTRYYHAGIVSWGIGCGGNNIPGVYASTTKIKGWILEELKNRNL